MSIILTGTSTTMEMLIDEFVAGTYDLNDNWRHCEKCSYPCLTCFNKSQCETCVAKTYMKSYSCLECYHEFDPEPDGEGGYLPAPPPDPDCGECYIDKNNVKCTSCPIKSGRCVSYLLGS
jgi:hypothetical protein